MVSHWILILIASLFSTIGNLCLKMSSLKGVSDNIILSYMNVWFLLGVIFFGMNLLFFFQSLKSIPVSIAYPVLAGSSFMFLAFFGNLFFNEVLSFFKIFGILLIITGIILVSYTTKI